MMYKFGIGFVAVLTLFSIFFLLIILKPELSVYVFLIFGVFYTPLYEYKFRLFGILVLPTDLMAILIYFSVFINRVFGRFKRFSFSHADKPKSIGNSFHVVIIALILWATFIGLFQGNYWKSVFRETKMVLYYGLIPVFVSFFISDRRVIFRYFAFLIVLSTIGSFYDLYCRIFDIYTVSAYAGGIEGAVTYADTPIGRIIRDYGWVSTFHYQVIAFLACLVFFFGFKNFFVRITLFIVALINLIANMLTVTRGFILGIIVGVILLIFLSGLRHSTSLFKAVASSFAVVIVIFGIFYLSMLFVPEVSAAFYRFTSVFSSEYAGRGDIENMNVRLSSIYLGINTGLNHPLGRGFGILSPTGEETFSEAMTLWLIYHNSIGYIFFTFGLIGGFVVFYLLAKLTLELLKIYRIISIQDKQALSLILVSLFAVFSMSFTSGNFLFNIDLLFPFIITLFSFSMFYIKLLGGSNVKGTISHNSNSFI